MAEQHENRTEQASAKRKADARREGNVASSRELPMAVTLLVGVGLLWALTQQQLTHLTTVMRTWIVHAGKLTITRDTFSWIAWTVAADLAWLLLPMMLSVMAGGITIHLFQTGWLWNPEKLIPNLSRLNPSQWFTRLASVKAWVDLAKSVLKISVIGLIVTLILKDDLAELVRLVEAPLLTSLTTSGHILIKTTLWVGGLLAILAAADYAFQRYQWERDLRMTKEEVKEERRESDGDPHVKARIKTLQRQARRRRMMAAVPKADVVITNPTHLAVALRYDRASMAAPTVVAKGAGFLAEQIRTIATAHRVPVIENKPVAQALYKFADIDQQIPKELYQAVAEILAAVYRAKRGTT